MIEFTSPRALEALREVLKDVPPEKHEELIFEMLKSFMAAKVNEEGFYKRIVPPIPVDEE